MSSPFYFLLNNVSDVLTAAHTIGDGLLQVSTISQFGSNFPIRVTCQRQSDNAVVIYQITGVSGSNLVVGQALEGTSDIALNVDDICAMRLTAGAIQDIENALVYTTSSPTTNTIGGIPANSSFSNTPLGTIVDQMLRGTAQVFTIYPISVSNVGLIVKGLQNQSANLQTWLDYQGNLLAAVDKYGNCIFNNGFFPAGTVSIGATPGQNQIIFFATTSNAVKLVADYSGSGGATFDIVTLASDASQVSRFNIDASGNVNINGKITSAVNVVTTPPLHNTSAGTQGDIAVDQSYIYVCTTTGTDGNAVWQRVLLSADTW